MNLVGIPARSVKFGWNFGISKVEGFETVTETTSNTLPAVANDIDSNLLSAYAAYYEEMAGAVGTAFASNIVSEANAKAIHDASDPDVVFVSVRKPNAFAEGHIDGATAPMGWANQGFPTVASVVSDK